MVGVIKDQRSRSQFQVVVVAAVDTIALLTTPAALEDLQDQRSRCRFGAGTTVVVVFSQHMIIRLGCTQWDLILLNASFPKAVSRFTGLVGNTYYPHKSVCYLNRFLFYFHRRFLIVRRQ